MSQNSNSNAQIPNYHHYIWELSERFPAYSQALNISFPANNNLLNSPPPENVKEESIPPTQNPSSAINYSQVTVAENPNPLSQPYISTAPPTPLSNTNSQAPTRPVTPSMFEEGGRRRKIRIKRKVPKTRKSKKSQSKKRNHRKTQKNRKSK